jgi:Ca2+-binding EF-hand superfamily protein
LRTLESVIECCAHSSPEPFERALPFPVIKRSNVFYFSVRLDGRPCARDWQSRLTPRLEMAGVDEDAAEKPEAESEETASTLRKKVFNYAFACIQRCKPKKKLISPFDAQVKTSSLLRKLRKEFARYDADGSGGLDVPELCGILGVDHRSFWARALLDFFDSDADGKIAFEEFVATLGVLGAEMEKHARKPRQIGATVVPVEVFFIFAILDHDGDGKIDRADFSHILWEHETRAEKAFGRLRSMTKVKHSSIDSSLQTAATEKYVAEQRAQRREFLRPVRLLVKSAILYLSRQCPEMLTIEDVAKLYKEFPRLFEIAMRLHKRLRKIVLQCTVLICKLHGGLNGVENLKKKMIEAAIRSRVEQEKAKKSWDWADKLQRSDGKEIQNRGRERLEDETLVEIAQIGRMLRGEKMIRSQTEDEQEFLSSFAFFGDGSFRRMEPRQRRQRMRGPRASGRGMSGSETSKMRVRQLSRQPPHEAAIVLAELGVTAQKQVIRQLNPELAAEIIVEMGQLEQDILLAHFKTLQPMVIDIKKQRRIVDAHPV